MTTGYSVRCSGKARDGRLCAHKLFIVLDDQTISIRCHHCGSTFRINIPYLMTLVRDGSPAMHVELYDADKDPKNGT